jgi:hypothetical protein
MQICNARFSVVYFRSRKLEFLVCAYCASWECTVLCLKTETCMSYYRQHNFFDDDERRKIVIVIVKMVPRKAIKFPLTSNMRKSMGRSTTRSLIIFGLVLAVVFLIHMNLSVVNSSPIRASDRTEFDHGPVAVVDSKRDSPSQSRREKSVPVDYSPNKTPANTQTHQAHPARQAIETTTTTTTTSKNLPSFEKGGLVFFLHIPKTGGTTIRKNLHNHTNHVLYRFVPGMGEYNKSLPIVERYIRTSSTRTRRPILFLEVHGRDSPNLLQLQNTLLRWKRTAAQSNIPTFFFTILREPLSHAVSYFNFFHVDRPNKLFEQVQATEENFLRLALYSPQCQFLSRGENSLRKKKKVKTTRNECHQVEETLLETMDWVGTTDRMSDETLPLLARLLNLKGASTFESQLVSTRFANASISKSRLGASTIHTIEHMLSFDRNMYEEVPKKFPLAMWKEYASEK